MQGLVADVGGTNTRFALTGADGVPQAARRFANDDFSSFEHVLMHYVTEAAEGPVDACCVAIAGPVTAETARLTNRDWFFDVGSISGRVGGAPVRLVNDLAALGHALAALGPDQLRDIRPGGGRGNGQKLVAGLGTGLNCCLAKETTEHPVVIEAEAGHASLPASVVAELPDPGSFPTAEHLFSGAGLSRLHAAAGRAEATSSTIVAAAGAGDAGARATVEAAAHALGVYARELVFQYMPLDGFFLAGSVGRGVLGVAEDAFIDGFGAGGRFSELLDSVPLRLITDDGAALYGMARLALQVAQRPTA